VFLLRGQDTFAPAILEIYANIVEQSIHPDKDLVRNTKAHAAAMRHWQETVKRELPDMLATDSVY